MSKATAGVLGAPPHLFTPEVATKTAKHVSSERLWCSRPSFRPSGP